MKRASAAIAVSALALVTVSPTLASAATKPPRPEVKSARVAFGSCGAGAITMKVAVAPRTVIGGQALNVIATVTNKGTKACTYTGGNSGPQGIGPCNALTMEVIDANGRDVWPANVAYACPLLLSEHLASRATLTATGSWQQRVNAPKAGLAPRGHYHLVVEKSSHLSFPFTIQRGPLPATGPAPSD